MFLERGWSTDSDLGEHSLYFLVKGHFDQILGWKHFWGVLLVRQYCTCIGRNNQCKMRVKGTRSECMLNTARYGETHFNSRHNMSC